MPSLGKVTVEVWCCLGDEQQVAEELNAAFRASSVGQWRKMPPRHEEDTVPPDDAIVFLEEQNDSGVFPRG